MVNELKEIELKEKELKFIKNEESRLDIKIDILATLGVGFIFFMLAIIFNLHKLSLWGIIPSLVVLSASFLTSLFAIYPRHLKRIKDSEYNLSNLNYEGWKEDTYLEILLYQINLSRKVFISKKRYIKISILIYTVSFIFVIVIIPISYFS